MFDAESVIFRTTPVGGELDVRNAPHRQFVATLSGTVEIEVGDACALRLCGNMPRRMVYDNLSATVSRVQFPRRLLTERIAALASHYAFKPSFAHHVHCPRGVSPRRLGGATACGHVKEVARGQGASVR